MAAAIDAVVWKFRFKNAFVEKWESVWKFNPVFIFFGCGRPAAETRHAYTHICAKLCMHIFKYNVYIYIIQIAQTKLKTSCICRRHSCTLIHMNIHRGLCICITLQWVACIYKVVLQISNFKILIWSHSAKIYLTYVQHIRVVKVLMFYFWLLLF